MNTFPNNFYDLLQNGLGANTSHRLQGYLDNVLAEKYNNNNLILDGVSINDDMLIDFTYQQIQKEVGLNVMAQYVDIDSDPIPVGTEGFTIGTGKMLRMKMVEFWNEDKMRKRMLAERISDLTSDDAGAAAERRLFNTIDTLIGGHTNAIHYQRNQMFSAGKVVLTDTNNPNGIQNVTLSANVPAANVKTLSSTKRWWTALSDGVYSTEGSACDPIANMKDMVRKMKRELNIAQCHFEVDDVFMDYILEHSKVIAAIASNQFPLANDASMAASAIANFDRSVKIKILGNIVGAPFKVIDSIVSVEKWDNTNKALSRTSLRSFNSNVIVLVPDGNIAELLTVQPIVIASGTYAYFYGGKLLLTVDNDAAKKYQSYNTEMTSLVVPNMPKLMFYLHPYSAS